MAYLSDRRTAGTPDPAEVITVTLGDKTFRAGRRTAAHLEATIEVHTDLHVYQGCYNTGVAASAGTHDFDGCVDVVIPSLSWDDAQTALRELGWAAWHRTTAQGFSMQHIHMVSLGCPGPVGIYVPGQVDDYYAHRSGLVGHVADPTWHPADINSTVFDYPASEDDMQDADWLRLQQMINKSVQDTVTALLAAPVGGTSDPATVKQALNQARQKS